MLYYVRVYISEGVDIDKTSASKESDICHFCYSLDKGVKVKPYACNGCHDIFWWCLWTLVILLF